eukprot:6456032-Amphidinium_carterae.3
MVVEYWLVDCFVTRMSSFSTNTKAVVRVNGSTSLHQFAFSPACPLRMEPPSFAEAELWFLGPCLARSLDEL